MTQEEMKKLVQERILLIKERIWACAEMGPDDPGSIRRARVELGLSGYGGVLNDLDVLWNDLEEKPLYGEQRTLVPASAYTGALISQSVFRPSRAS